jgi:sugar phosphate isomerase/epimerase
MTFRDRIGIDLGRKLAIEDGIRWAAGNAVRHVDAQIDLHPNALERLDQTACAAIRDLAGRLDVRVGLHTLSAVNVAEVSPFLRDATDRYIEAYIDRAAWMGAATVVVHAGYHFTDDRAMRMEASRERLKRAVAHAEDAGVTLLLENMNWEPNQAEVHYLAHTVEECLFYFDAIPSTALAWSFTINHATLLPEGIEGFLAAMPANRLREVRVADNHGKFEAHLFPGEGIVDWAAMFVAVEATGFTGPYMCGFGTLDEMLRGRDVILDLARRGGFTAT